MRLPTHIKFNIISNNYDDTNTVGQQQLHICFTWCSVGGRKWYR